MSNSNTFTKDLTQTPLSNAYLYQTYSEYINKMIKPQYYSNCIFCSCKESISLVSDGSFRQCSHCKKQFKAKISTF
jgi:hypothetical protein